ncbi:hypothetical protein [Sedimentibacter sp. MB31-C6]|uniref:hypothetical protein n=1 Tax=Sedimentibacter sp. MB31-C6 TaxID=3109366 RepID=UPI002DDD3327|nr:hypothetical protein [Sedimentibacter sp. MB36-C1]WSI03344.1 hypothetical protein U8307_09825 [Sedimentibacter sp. MB36-C1]
MNNKNNNYRVMKFLEPVNKKDKAKGYVRLDIRGIRGNILVSVENLGDVKSTSDVYLYKDKINKIKLGQINNKRGMIKKILTFGNNNAIEDYNTCAIVNDKKIVMYANLFNTVSLESVRKLEETDNEENYNVDIKSMETEQKETKEIHNEEKNSEELIKGKDKDEEVELVQNNDEKDIVEDEEEKEEKADKGEKETEKVIETAKKQVPEKQPQKQKDFKNDIRNLGNKDKISDKIESEAEKRAGLEAVKKKVYKNKFEENLYKALGKYERIEPLSVKIKDLSWWYIPYNEKGIKNGSLPFYNKVISSYYPYPVSYRVTTCSGLMEKYEHYVFGIYKDKGNVNRYVYGIPGEFKRDEQPYKGVTGFKNWSYKNKKTDGEYGYWLAFVDSNSGEITDPPQIVLIK